MLVHARIVRHAVDVRPHEGQKGDTEGLQIRHRLGVVLVFNKRLGMVFDGPGSETGAHDPDGMAARANEGIECTA
jgi:hypothetical protein